jgi:outer membrane lipoprotein SlyB
MASRSSFGKLTILTLVAGLGLAACASTITGNNGATATRATVPSGEAEKQLERQAATLQRTILEGALAGAAMGGLMDSALGGDDDIGAGIGIGLIVGASAGTYVAYIQQQYSNKEKRLIAIKSDIDENSAEVQQTINVMNEVLAVQRAELAAVRTKIKSGTSSPASLQAELAQANANLANMQRAISGANKRHAELGTVRGLTPVSNGVSAIDPDLAALSQQISSMKAIASDLAKEL